MELRTLAYVVAIADHGTVSAAAEALRVTQPSLSRQLRTLEHELEVRLFDRTRGRLRLSPAGRALLPLARELLDRAEALRAAARLQARGSLERVTIAAPGTTLTDIVSPFLATLTPDDPVPAVVEADGLTAEEARRRGADLIITAGRPGPPMASLSLPPLQVWAYVPGAHALAGGWAVRVTELASQPLIMVPPHHLARRAFDAAALAAGVAAGPAVEASNGTVAQALAAAGRGVAVVSDDIRYDLVPVAIHTAGDRPVVIRLTCAWDSTTPAAPTLADLAARIAAYVVRTYGDGEETAALVSSPGRGAAAATSGAAGSTPPRRP